MIAITWQDVLETVGLLIAIPMIFVGLFGATFGLVNAFLFGERRRDGIALKRFMLTCLVSLSAAAAMYGVCWAGLIFIDRTEGNTITEKVTVCKEINSETICRKEFRTFDRGEIR